LQCKFSVLLVNNDFTFDRQLTDEHHARWALLEAEGSVPEHVTWKTGSPQASGEARLTKPRQSWQSRPSQTFWDAARMDEVIKQLFIALFTALPHPFFQKHFCCCALQAFY
jgi:hypothetical protein